MYGRFCGGARERGWDWELGDNNIDLVDGAGGKAETENVRRLSPSLCFFHPL